MNAPLMMWKVLADQIIKKEFQLASFSLSASDSGSSGVAYPASGNFTSCKDKKEEGGREGGGGRAVCSWKTLRVPVLLAGKEIDKQEKEETRK